MAYARREAQRVYYVPQGRTMSNYVQIDATLLGNAHNENKCAGQHCVLHNPSDHHMRNWTQAWTDVTRTMSRVCPHSLTHPDPDDVNFYRRRYGDTVTAATFVHTCDGCCQPAPDLIPPPAPRGSTVSVESE